MSISTSNSELRITVSGGKTAIQRIIQDGLNVLRSFGSDAHVWFGGVGTINGLTAGNYITTDGASLGAYDNPVGLVLDAAGVTSNVINIGATSVGVVSAGSAVPGLSQIISVVANRAYRFTYVITSISGSVSTTLFGQANGVQQLAAGVFVETLFATASAPLTVGLLSRGAGITSITASLVVDELTGIHATQSLTGSKPILRLGANGKPYWQFDGNDSLSLSSVPFQMADDHCVIAGGLCTAAAGSQSLLTVSNTGNTNPVIGLDFNAGAVRGWWRDDAGVLVASSDSINRAGSIVVASMRKFGGVKVARTNGVAATSDSTVMGITTLNTANIGALVRTTTTNYLTGSIYPTIAIKGAVSDTDLLALERFVGLCSGVTI